MRVGANPFPKSLQWLLARPNEAAAGKTVLLYEFGARLPFDSLLAPSSWRFNSLQKLSLQAFQAYPSQKIRQRTLVSWRLSYKNLFRNAEWSFVGPSIEMNALVFGVALQFLRNGVAELDVGTLVAFEEPHVALSPSVSVGYWQVFDLGLGVGVRLLAPHDLDWEPVSSRQLEESTPLIVEGNFVWRVVPSWVLVAGASHQGWKNVRYGGQVARRGGRFEPMFWRFSVHHKNQLVAGLHTEPFFSRAEAQQQPLSVGVAFVGGSFKPFRIKNLAINLVLMDKTLLRRLGVFESNPAEELVRIGIESRF